ncbi:MAG: hypothetical protein ABI574_13295 [Burkholderiales bacterium]
MSTKTTSQQITVCDGKYTVVIDGGKLTALRYGEAWQDLTGNSLVYWIAVELQEARALIAAPVIAYTPGDWYRARSVEDMQAFFRSRLPFIREAAREHGYAIGLHGSERRDLDLIAAPWRDGAADAETLAHAVAIAACGIDRAGRYEWNNKPLGRIATSIPICWTEMHGVRGAGHMDLSVMPVQPAASAGWRLVPVEPGSDA